MSTRASHGSKSADWVGKCTKCHMWRTAEHTIINRVTSTRFCMFDGAPIHLRCAPCLGTGKELDDKCQKCAGSGMDFHPTQIDTGRRIT